MEKLVWGWDQKFQKKAKKWKRESDKEEERKNDGRE
jgi:hypothetical protein